jgi:hypothetical protein
MTRAERAEIAETDLRQRPQKAAEAMFLCPLCPEVDS